MRSTFVRESIGINPLRSRRDWLALAFMMGIIVTACLLVTLDNAGPLVRGALIGALCGGLPPLIMCLPVHGRVAAENSASFMGRVEQSGFARTADTSEGRIYTPKRPRWMAWDANRIVIRDTADGALQVTAPLQFYYSLKRRQR